MPPPEELAWLKAMVQLRTLRAGSLLKMPPQHQVAGLGRLVDERQRRRADVGQVQERLSREVTVPTRYAPDITLEELDGDQVVVQIVAIPQHPGDGSRLADEILAAVR